MTDGPAAWARIDRGEAQAEIRAALEIAFTEDVVRLAEHGLMLDEKARAGLKRLYEIAWTRGAKWANQNAVDVMTGT